MFQQISQFRFVGVTSDLMLRENGHIQKHVTYHL